MSQEGKFNFGWSRPLDARFVQSGQQFSGPTPLDLEMLAKGAPVLKATNPKDRVGVRKVPMSVIPAEVIMEIGLGMLEGARKYGRHNYRVSGVLASVYYDAAMRHLMAWWEGQDIDPASQLNHITKCLTTLTVLRDAMLNDMFYDDRPPKLLNQEWVDELNEKAGDLIDKYPDAKEPNTEAKDD